MTFHCWLTRITNSRGRIFFFFYLIKLAQHKNANLNLILTRKCFTIAIKTIQLSSHIIKHDEFIKATFSSEQFFETNNIFALNTEQMPSISRLGLPYGNPVTS